MSKQTPSQDSVSDLEKVWKEMDEIEPLTLSSKTEYNEFEAFQRRRPCIQFIIFPKIELLCHKSASDLWSSNVSFIVVYPSDSDGLFASHFDSHRNEFRVLPVFAETPEFFASCFQTKVCL